MYALNTMNVIGYIARPIEGRQLPSGASVADFTLVVPSIIDGEHSRMIPTYITVTLWRKLAEIAEQYCQVGTQVYIQGHLETDSWQDQEGKERSRTKLIGDNMIILSPKAGPHPALPETLSLADGLNSVTIIGNITRDIELRTTPQGKSVTSFGVATNRVWKSATGEQQEKTEYHNIVVWDSLAEVVSKHLSKGKKVYVEGRLQNRSYETPTGEKRYVTEVIARDVKALGHQSSLQLDGDMTFSGSDSIPAPADTSVPNVQYNSTVQIEDLPF